MRGRKRGTPLKDVILPLLACLVVKWLQIDTDMLLIITSTGNELFRAVNINDLEWPWTPIIGGFSNFFSNFGLKHTFQQWIAPKWLETDQNNRHMKCSAVNADFSSPSDNPLLSTRPAHSGVKHGYPPKKWLFFCYWLVYRENACR